MTSRDTYARDTYEAPQIGLHYYLEVVWRRKLIIVTVLLFAIGAALLRSLSQQSIYEAQTTIVVGQAGGLVQPQNANAIQPFSATMKELLTSTIVAQGVIRALNLQTTPESLLGKVSVSTNPQSAALKVSVEDASPESAEAIASQIGLEFSRLVARRFGATTSKRSADGTQPMTAAVWDPAHVVPGKVSPRPVRDAVIAGVLGGVLGLLAAFLRDQFGRTLRTREEIEEAFGSPVIGQIPAPQRRRDGRRALLWDDRRELAEPFRTLRANLQYLGVSRAVRKVLVTSPSQHQGKTTVSANLAAAIAQSNSSVVIVETDLRRPHLEDFFGVAKRSKGLTGVLAGSAKVERALKHIAPTSGSRAAGRMAKDRIAFLPSGAIPPNPAELVASEPMRQLLDQLASEYEYVVLDAPPLLPVADALELARLVDGVVLVVRSKHVTREDAHEVRALVERLGIQLLGVVVTGVATRTSYSAYRLATARPQRSRREGRDSSTRRSLPAAKADRQGSSAVPSGSSLVGDAPGGASSGTAEPVAPEAPKGSADDQPATPIRPL
jgi:succinoglycan biosynthesis transport protein ExoP